MSELPLLFDLDYGRFIRESSDPAFLRQLAYVGDFTYVAETNFLGGWAEDKERRVTLRLQRSLQEALRLSGFHNQSHLEMRRYSDGIEFDYRDPDYGFTYAIDGRGRISITRRRTTLRRFHEWYRRLMPSLPSLVFEAVETLDEELSGFTEEERERDRDTRARQEERAIRVERASYNFAIAVAITGPGDRSSGSVKDVSTPEPPPVTNIQILSRSLLRRVPSNSGDLVDPLTLPPDDFGRVTYQVNRWTDPEHAYETYRVSGPSNNDWRSLYFELSYNGDTYVAANGDRMPFRQKAFVTGTTTTQAYLRFFRDAAVCGFVKGVLFGNEQRSGGEVALRSLELGVEYSMPGDL